MSVYNEDHPDWIQGPVWTDWCNHSPEEYVGSFEYFSKVGFNEFKKYRYDLYVLDHESGRKSLCLRYGDDAHEYMSPGYIETILQLSLNNELYNLVVGILRSKGVFTWKKTVDSKQGLSKNS